MNREIKFRAWDRIGKRMIPSAQMLPANGESETATLIFMQYTGLNDKNGKEIYESDRVKTPAGIGVVRWERCFRLFWNDRDSTTLHDCIEKHLEVIGNIYEP